MIETVPAFATARTAHCSTCDGASPGAVAAVRARARREFAHLVVERAPALRVVRRGRPARGPHRVDADRIDHPIHTDAARQLQDRVDRIVVVEIDDLRALRARHLEPRYDAIDRDHAPRAHQLRARDRELADGPRAEYRDRVAHADLGELRAEIAGRKDVGHQDRALVVERIGQADQARMRERRARVFGLQAVECAARLRAAEERGAGERTAGIRGVALRGVARAAVCAMPARDRRRNQHAVAAAKVAHVAPDFLDEPDALVPENRPRFHAAQRAAHHVQIGAADRARREPHDRVGRLREAGVGHRVDPDVADAVKYDRFHDVALRVTC